MDVIAKTQSATLPPPLPSDAQAAARPGAKSWPYVSGPGFQEAVELPAESDRSFVSFLGDLLDVVNPLQHIPLVSAAYRNITGDAIRPEAQIAGDVLFGGPIGLVASLANQAIAHNTGRDISEHVLALFDSDLANAPAQSAEISPIAEEPQIVAQEQPAPPATPMQIALAELPPAPKPVAEKIAAPSPGAMNPPELAVFSQSPKPPKDAVLPMVPGEAPGNAPSEAPRFLPIERAVTPKSSRLTSKSIELGPIAQQVEGNLDARRALRAQTPPIAEPREAAEGIIAGGGFVPLPAEPPKQTPAQSSAKFEPAPKQTAQTPAHPLLPPEAAGREGEWIANRMAEALDKYQRNARMAKEAL